MTTLRIVLRAVIVALHTCPTRAITRVTQGIRRIPESTVEASPSFADPSVLLRLPRFALRFGWAPGPGYPASPPPVAGPVRGVFVPSCGRTRSSWMGGRFGDGGRAEARSLVFAAFRLPRSPIPEEDQLGERGHDSRTAPNPPRTPDRPGPARRTGVARSTQGRATRGAGRGERGG